MFQISFLMALMSPCLGQYFLSPYLQYASIGQPAIHSGQNLFNLAYTFLSSPTLLPQREAPASTLNPVQSPLSPYFLPSPPIQNSIFTGQDIFKQQPKPLEPVTTYQTNQVLKFPPPTLLPSDPVTSTPSTATVTVTSIPSIITTTTAEPQLLKLMVTCETKNISDSICSASSNLICDGETLKALIEIYQATEDEDTSSEKSEAEKPELLNLLSLLSSKNDGLNVNIDALCAVTTSFAEQACTFSKSLQC